MGNLITPEIDSLYYAKASEWGQYYALLEQQLGATATLLDFGSKRSGKATAASFTGRKFSATGLSPTWTWSEAPSAFDTPFRRRRESNWQGLAPVLTFNGTDEECDTPDAAYWTRVETAAFSMGAWINPSTVASAQAILAKWDDTTGTEAREWLWRITSSATLELNLADESANVSVSRPSSASIVVNRWTHVAITYTGDGGADAADSINLYINGAASNGTAVNDGSYVAMEDLTTVVKMAHYKGAAANTAFFVGKMLGGPWSPFFTQVELTAEQIANIYEGLRGGLGI